MSESVRNAVLLPDQWRWPPKVEPVTLPWRHGVDNGGSAEPLYRMKTDCRPTVLVIVDLFTAKFCPSRPRGSPDFRREAAAVVVMRSNGRRPEPIAATDILLR